MPTVSVILPTYNRAGLLQAAIQSVLSQTYTNYELIVVDDGSSDETTGQVHAINDPRLIYLHHAQNKGAAAARNTGMRAAQGGYIAFLDSDDTWHPGKLEQQVTFLNDSTDEVGGCVASYRLVFENHSVIREIPMEPSFYKQSLKGCNLSPGSTLLFKKDCLDKVGFQNESLKRFEDWEWQIRFARFYQWQRVPLVLADIRAGRIVSFETAKQSLDQFQNLIEGFSCNDPPCHPRPRSEPRVNSSGDPEELPGSRLVRFSEVRPSAFAHSASARPGLTQENLTSGMTRGNLQTIKMAISYELFYAAWKNRLWGRAVGYLVSSFFKNPRMFVGFIVSLLRRKTKEQSNESVNVC